MSQTIKLKRGITTPTTTDIVSGEVAVDTSAQKLYVNDAGTVKQVGVSVTGDTMTGDLSFGDNDKVIFGAGDDLQLYHDGSNSRIVDAGTGELKISANLVRITNAANTETAAAFIEDGACSFRYNNAIKLATTSTGIDVTGSVNADDLTIDGVAVINSDSTTAITATQNGNTDSNGLNGLRINNSTGTTYGAFGNAGASGVAITAGDAGGTANTSLSFRTAASGVEAERVSIDSTGIDVTGTVTADSATIDGDVSIGTTTATKRLTVEDGNDAVARFNRTATGGSSTGSITEFSRAGTLAGHIGSQANNYMYIGQSDTNLAFSSANNLIFPRGTNGAARTGAIDLGNSSNRFKSIYATNQVYATTYGPSTDTNTKITFEGSDVITFDNGGSESMRLNASGYLGLNITAPSSMLHVKGDTTGVADTVAEFGNGSNSNSLQVLTSDGNLSWGFNALNSRNLVFQTNQTERMRVDSSGNVLVGKTAVGANTEGIELRNDGLVKLVRDAQNLSLNRITSTGTIQQFKYANTEVGTIDVSATTTTYNTSSDRRLKQNIADADDAGDLIDGIRVRKFDWKADGSHQPYGMIAQELLEPAPEAVSVPDDPDGMLGVDYSKLVPMLIKEIQSLRARVAQLEEQN